MKNTITFLFLAIVLSACTKPKTLNPNNIIFGETISNRALVADGTTTVDVTVNLNPSSDSSKRSVIFRCSSGMFLPAKDTIITVTAAYENKVLVARTKFQVSLFAGEVHFWIYPSSRVQQQDLIIKDSLNIKTSLPSTMTLTPSASSLKNDFGTEVTLTALLQNVIKYKVSSGTLVSFSDMYPNGQPVGGYFRATRDTTDSSSTAVTNYSVDNNVQPGQVYIICTYNNPQGTSIKDTCILNVIPN